jgi:hypothetical protein
MRPPPLVLPMAAALAGAASGQSLVRVTDLPATGAPAPSDCYLNSF